MLNPGLPRPLAAVSSPFPKPVLRGAQAWLLAESPHQPFIFRYRVCSPPSQAILSSLRHIWVKSPVQGQIGYLGSGPKAA